MKFLMLACATSDSSPPQDIRAETKASVATARAQAGRSDGGRLRPPEEAVVLGPDPRGAVSAAHGARVQDDEQVVGFDVITCADLDEAVALLRTHPMAAAGRIELRQVWDDA